MKSSSQILLMKVLKLGDYFKTYLMVLAVCWNHSSVICINFFVSGLLRKYFSSTIFLITAYVSNWWIKNPLKNANCNRGREVKCG